MKIPVLLACLLLGACVSPHDPNAVQQPQGAAVIIKDTHLHTRYCGHYIYKGQWYFLAQHRHGVDCDHELVDGVWTLLDE